MEEGDTIAKFLDKVQKAMCELTNLSDNTFTNNTVMAKILSQLSACYGLFPSSWENMPTSERTISVMTRCLIREKAQTHDLAIQLGSKNGGATTYATIFKPKVGSSSGWTPLTQKQREKRRKEKTKRKKNITYWNCGKFGHWTRECLEEENTSDKVEELKAGSGIKTHQAFMAIGLGPCSYNWYMDSCCPQHISKDREWFSIFQDISSDKQTVEGIGGVTLIE